MKDYKGGYVIVDATGLHLDNAGTVNGLYQQIKDAVAVNKAVMIRNIKYGTATLTPMYSTVDVDDISNSVSLNVYGGVITVYNDDDVTFTESPSTKSIAEDVEAIGTETVVNKFNIDTVAENNKVKVVRFSNIFNHAEFGINDVISIGLITKRDSIISVVSVGKGILFEGRYNTDTSAWVSRTVTELTPYTPA